MAGTLRYDGPVSDVVYLDICCFKRPFDDGAQERIRREAAAVAAVLDATARGHFRLVRSPAHDFENARNPREDRRVAIAKASEARWFVTTDDRLLKGARRQQEHIRVQVIGPDQLPLPTEGAEA
jgi:predicted nucleic acid-binding protein